MQIWKKHHNEAVTVILLNKIPTLVVTSFTLTFSLILTGRELKAIPLQKLSTRLAMVPSREILMFSPWTLWKSSGGRLFVPPPFDPDLEAATKKSPFRDRHTMCEPSEFARNRELLSTRA
jgi:hypothetical protein